MATKKGSKVPANRYLRYELTNSGTPGTETSHYVDLARDLSRINRRLMRQGRVYHIKKITVVSSNTPNGGNRISVGVAHDTWVTRNAWKRGFETFKMMQKEATKQISGDVSGTWDDFKVWLTPDMENGGSILQPVDNGGGAALPGEWVYSKFTTPDGTTSADDFMATLLGTHIGAAGARRTVSLCRSYAESRSTVNSPDPNVLVAASDDPLVNVFDYGTAIDEVIDNMQDDNDEPPYSLIAYPGAGTNMPKPSIAQDTTLVDGRAIMGSFSAICGLLEFEAKSTVANDTFSVLIEMAPGPYRGIAAEVI